MCESSVGESGRIYAFICLSVYSPTTNRCVWQTAPARRELLYTKFIYENTHTHTHTRTHARSQFIYLSIFHKYTKHSPVYNQQVLNCLASSPEIRSRDSKQKWLPSQGPSIVWSEAVFFLNVFFSLFSAPLCFLFCLLYSLLCPCFPAVFPVFPLFSHNY